MDVEDFDMHSELEKTMQEEKYTEFEGGLKIPASMYSCLFDYQRTCLKWLWELHCQDTGGIVGDEMVWNMLSVYYFLGTG